MMGFAIAYDPCPNCGKKEMCSMCELTMRRNGAIKDERQSEGEWKITKGSHGKEIMICTNCRHSQDLNSTFTYCPNCGAKMKVNERDDDSEEDR